MIPVLATQESLPLVYVGSQENDVAGYQLVLDHLNRWLAVSGTVASSDSLPRESVDNLIRLGLVRVHFDSWLTGVATAEYDRIKALPAAEAAVVRAQENDREHFCKDYMVHITTFGHSFAQAVSDNPPSSSEKSGAMDGRFPDI